MWKQERKLNFYNSHLSHISSCHHYGGIFGGGYRGDRGEKEIKKLYYKEYYTTG